ncbi:MAG TPA: nucleoside deaminase [Opitutaceae bacterium]|nr:nucleoside deaminase [Opitutaceae bacterium]
MKTKTLLSFTLPLAALSLAWATAPAVAPLPDDPSCTAEDRKFMARAAELASSAVAHGNSAYGALLVKDGKILIEGENDATTSRDITHHAETGLLSVASVKYGRAFLADCILYTSTEPCIMCCGSIRAAGLKKFVYGVTATQVSRLRGRPVPANPLECREVYERTGSSDVTILGPLMEAEGLAIHAAAAARPPAKR